MSTTVAVTMVKDEVDIIAATVGNMLTQCHAVIVADNGSTDGTRAILENMAALSNGRLLLVVDDDPAYRQSEKMTALAHRAHDHFGATWVVPFDADEWWYSPFATYISDALDDVADQWLVVPARLYDHVATGADNTKPDPTRRIVWRRPDPAPLPKVAVRWREDLVIHQGNHGASYEGGPTTFDPVLVVRHFPYRSVAQFVAKVRNGAAAYAAMGDNVPANVGTHWRQWGAILDAHGPDAVADIFRTWYWRADPKEPVVIHGEAQPALIYDPVR